MGGCLGLDMGVADDDTAQMVRVPRIWPRRGSGSAHAINGCERQVVRFRCERHARGTALILAGQRELVAAWVSGRIRFQEPFITGYEALGALDHAGNLIGGFVYSEFRRFPQGGIVAICAAGECGWLSRGNLKVFLGSYPFGQLGCHKIHATVAKNNRRARRVIERLGFKNEGLIREGLGINRDAILYGLLAHESIWNRN